VARGEKVYRESHIKVNTLVGEEEGPRFEFMTRHTAHFISGYFDMIRPNSRRIEPRHIGGGIFVSSTISDERGKVIIQLLF
jgi:hypothetical protein